MLFQRIIASHLANPMALPPINDLILIFTGFTSDIGSEIARQLAKAGGHVIMAVRDAKAAHDLIKKRQWDWSGRGLTLNIEMIELNLLLLESVVRFAGAYNAGIGPLHALINNAGIFQFGSQGSPKISQAAYRLNPYFIFSAEKATDPQIPKYCEMLKVDEWLVFAFISQDCRPTCLSEEAHNVETSYSVWERTLELIGLPSDAVERLIEEEEIGCKYGASVE